MLANQVKLPEVQVSKESTKANEIKGARDNSADRNFERIMQNGRREQQNYDKQQDMSRRQADAQEAKKAEQVQRRDNDRIERRDDRKEAPLEIKRRESDNTEVQGKDESDSRSDNEQNHNHNQESATKSEVDKAVEQPDKNLVQQLEHAEKSETSKWLDTILSLAPDSQGESESSLPTEQGTDAELSLDNQISMLLVKQVLANNNSDTDISELEGKEQVSLAELESLLTDSDFKAILAQLSNSQASPEIGVEQEFEQLLAKVTNTESESVTKANVDAKSVRELINQAAVSSSQPNSNIQQANLDEGELKQQSQPIQLNASQIDKTLLEKSPLEKQDKFKQSELMAALQLNGEGTEEQELTSSTAKPTAAELLSPTTKVVDLGVATQVNTEPNKAALNTLSALSSAQTPTEQMMKSELNLADMQLQTSTEKDTSESKLSSLLGQLGTEDVKTSDLANKTEKVNVAGVTLDKTLQMPKIENISQAKNEAVVKENILFNKQELATQMQTQVGLMLAKNMKSVDMRLDPPELGSMQVKLSVQNDQASVSFVVSSQQAKDALEASFPKLKELLEQQGLELADSDVQQQDSQAGSKREEEEQGIAKNGLDAEHDSTESELEQQQQMINRAINSPWNVSYYA